MNHLILQDIADSIVKFKIHPFSCWFATMLMCFGGSILSNFVTSHPLLVCFDDHRSVILASIIWYLINYAPFDVFYRICKMFPVRLLICTLKEVQRAKKISIGVHHGYEHFPDSPAICIVLGLLKGSGSTFMRPIALLVMGVFRPTDIPSLNIPVTTKLSLLASVVLYCDQIKLIPLPHNEVVLAVTCVLIYMRISMLLLGLRDPFLPLENILCTVLFGGLVDALKNAFDKRQGAQTANGTIVDQDSSSSGNPSSDVANSNGHLGGAKSKPQSASAPDKKRD